jgi:cytochrome bd-type quinol oxidase subunit 2
VASIACAGCGPMSSSGRTAPDAKDTVSGPASGTGAPAQWLDRPYLLIFPMIGVVALLTLAVSVARRRDHLLVMMISLIFVAAFCTLATSFWPYMLPFSITIADAAAPSSSLSFMFWGEAYSSFR